MDALTAQHRQRQLALRSVTIRELIRLWPALDWTRLDATYPAWAASVGRLVLANRQTSVGLASAYVRAIRQAAGIPGAPPAVMAEALALEKLATSIRVTSVVPLKRWAAAGAVPEAAKANALVLMAGAMSRHVLDGGRDQVRVMVANDPAAVGWERVTSGKGCGFCRMLAGRGGVYKEATADFRSHDHCSCQPRPVYNA